MTQRLAILLAVVAVGLLYLPGAEVARAAGGSAGCTLLFAGSPLEAVGWFVLMSVPAVLIGGLVSTLGNPLGGVFTVAVGLLFPAVSGGPIDQWLRNAASAGAYWVLIAEAAVWAGLIVVAVVSCYGLSRAARSWLPDSLLAGDRWRDRGPEPSEVRPARWVWGFHRREQTGILGALYSHDGLARLGPGRVAALQFWGSAAVTTAVGGILAAMLMQSGDIWQVVGSLILAFMLSGLLGHQLFPSANPLGVLLSPLVAGAAWYAWVATAGLPDVSLLRAYFTDQLPNGGVALPIYYAAAGVAGASIGLGWSQDLIETHRHQDAVEDEAGAGPAEGTRA